MRIHKEGTATIAIALCLAALATVWVMINSAWYTWILLALTLVLLVFV